MEDMSMWLLPGPAEALEVPRAEKVANSDIQIGEMTLVTKRHRATALAASLLAFVCVAMILSRHSRSVAVQATAPVDVDVAAVISTTVTDYQDYSGRTEAIDRVEVRPLVAGTIVGVHFADGALVKRGDLLFTIDPRPFVAEVDRASAELAAARARDGYASTEAARTQRLLTDNAIAKRDYDRAQNAARESAANVLSAQAALEKAKVNLTYTSIVAPVTGRVSRAEMTLGNVVSSGADAPVLTTLVSLSPIYASFDVDEQTYLRYLSHRDGPGIPVSLGLADEVGFSREGKVDSVDNQMDPHSGTIRVRAIFDNADYSLVPGLYARIKVGGGAPHAAVLVQTAAVGTDQDKTYVLVVDPSNRILYREVVIASERDDGLSVVKSGLSPGERIVVGGLQRVKAHDLARPHEVAMAATVTSAGGASQS
jgi:multidrug efflux system membrane fusion protein